MRADHERRCPGSRCRMILAALMSRFSFLYAFFRPALQVIKATPVASFIILALVWIKSMHWALSPLF